MSFENRLLKDLFLAFRSQVFDNFIFGSGLSSSLILILSSNDSQAKFIWIILFTLFIITNNSKNHAQAEDLKNKKKKDIKTNQFNLPSD